MCCEPSSTGAPVCQEPSPTVVPVEAHVEVSVSGLNPSCRLQGPTFVKDVKVR